MFKVRIYDYESAGQWWAGLAHTGPEEASYVRKKIHEEKNHWQQWRSKNSYGDIWILFFFTEERQACEFLGAHCWSLLGCFRGEAGGRAFIDCVGCTPGFRQTSIHLQFLSVRDHRSLHDTTPHWQRSRQILWTKPSSILGHPTVCRQIRWCTLQRINEQRLFSDNSEDRFHHSGS